MIPRLCAISPGDLRDEDAQGFLASAAAAAGAGLPGLLWREPALSDRVYLDMACRLRDLLAGRFLCIHDRPHLAAGARADAVQLSFRGLPAADVRAMLPRSVLVGSSAHDGDDPARHSGADYLLLGPVRDTPSKRGWKSPIGFDGLAREASRSGKPCLAVGGLQPVDAGAAFAAGAVGIAVSAGVFGGGDAGLRVREYLAACAAAKL